MSGAMQLALTEPPSKTSASHFIFDRIEDSAPHTGIVSAIIWPFFWDAAAMMALSLEPASEQVAAGAKQDQQDRVPVDFSQSRQGDRNLRRAKPDSE